MIIAYEEIRLRDRGKQSEYSIEKITGKVRKIGTPEDVANVAVFLASDCASYVTGGLYSVDGGESTSSIFSK